MKLDVCFRIDTDQVMRSPEYYDVGYILVSSDINTILNVLSGWLEEFRSVDVISEESATANASTARSIEASVP